MRGHRGGDPEGIGRLARLRSNFLHVAAIAISVALCIGGYVFIVRAINEQFQIQHEINLKLPSDKRFESTFWWFGTHERFRQLQHDLLAESPRPRSPQIPIDRICAVGVRNVATPREPNKTGADSEIVTFLDVSVLSRAREYILCVS